ncbi:MAG TPA: prepilin-type N-terminal cleavage/methylation domain-containing protein [Xanthomonadaceae bacterium]|nr:prepilin-type N-terminal cleavage/methylation domain-containing protein [Xanthomonadaceae bacterium]
MIRSRATGFSLIEMIAAMFILALGLGLLLQVLGGSLNQARRAQEHTEAALWAQSFLDTLGMGEPLEPGSESGEFDERYRWDLDVSEAAWESDSGISPDSLPYVLYRVELNVRWGSDGRDRHATFETLRVSTRRVF